MTLSRLSASSHRSCRVCASIEASLHSFRLNGVSLHDALGWQGVVTRVLSLPVSERLFSVYFSLLERTSRLESLDPVFRQLSSALLERAEASRAPLGALEAWVSRHALCQASWPLPEVAGFSSLEVAAALDVFAHAAPWELSVLPSRLVSGFERLLPDVAGVTVLHASLHPSSVLAPALHSGFSVVRGDLASLAECVGPSSGLSCVFLPHLDPHHAPHPSLISSVVSLLDDSLPFQTRLELAAELSQEKPMLSL
jgi:hypothetical protein